MIELNEATFANGKKEMAEQDSGYYRRNQKSLTLFNREGRKIGVINRHGVLCCATLVAGRWWYSHAQIDEVGRWSSYTQEREDIQRALRDTAYQSPRVMPRPVGEAVL